MSSKRLFACAGFVRENANVCDVGCDHAYLSCYLVKNGIAKNVTATDINEMPLESARKNIAACGFSSKIKTMISDGLLNVKLSEIDDIIIAGMGGELILKIIEQSMERIDENMRLILQPMTNIPTLRYGLYENGFVIEDEIAVFEKGHWYTIIKAKYTGDVKSIDMIFAKMGAHVNKSCDENSREYIKYMHAKNERILANLKKSQNPDEEKISEYDFFVSELKKLV